MTFDSCMLCRCIAEIISYGFIQNALCFLYHIINPLFSGKVEFSLDEDAHVIGDCIKVTMTLAA